MAVVAGQQAGFAGGHDMIAHNVTALETCDVPQFAFAAFSGVAAGHKVNSPIGRYISWKELNFRVCKEHRLHAPGAEQTVAEDAVHLCHTLVFEISVGRRHCCPSKMDGLARWLFLCPRQQMQRKTTTTTKHNYRAPALLTIQWATVTIDSALTPQACPDVLVQTLAFPSRENGRRLTLARWTDAREICTSASRSLYKTEMVRCVIGRYAISANNLPVAHLVY